MFIQPSHTLTVDLSKAKTIQFNNQKWFVPVLALRQTIKIIPALGRLLPTLGRLQNDPAALTEMDADLLVTVIFLALGRAYPTLTLDQFLDCHVTLNELVSAIPVIVEQCGMGAPPATDTLSVTAPVLQNEAA